MDKIRIYIALLFCLTLSFIPPVLAQDTSGSNSNRYNTQYSYDCMGNITSLSRNGLLDDWSGAYRFYVKDYQFDEGYCQAERYNTSMDSFTFRYYDCDHLSNIRQVREADGSRSGEVIQKINYYPFGAQFCDGVAVSNVQSRKYNGKEYDNMHGLNTYDYGARQYNPVTVRWDRMDPLCEKYYDVSPYNYCRNNPILYFDKNGCEGEDFLTKFGDSFQNVGLAAAAFGTATIIISAEAEIATLGVSSIPSVVGVSSGAAAIIAGSVTYTIGSAMKITERIMQNASSQGKKSVDSGKNERHGDGGRAVI